MGAILQYQLDGLVFVLQPQASHHVRVLQVHHQAGLQQQLHHCPVEVLDVLLRLGRCAFWPPDHLHRRNHLAAAGQLHFAEFHGAKRALSELLAAAANCFWSQSVGIEKVSGRQSAKHLVEIRGQNAFHLQ